MTERPDVTVKYVEEGKQKLRDWHWGYDTDTKAGQIMTEISIEAASVVIDQMQAGPYGEGCGPSMLFCPGGVPTITVWPFGEPIEIEINLLEVFERELMVDSYPKEDALAFAKLLRSFADKYERHAESLD